jgi:protein TonB
VITPAVVPLVAPPAIVRENPIAPMMVPLPEAEYSTGIIHGSDFEPPPPAKPAQAPPQAPVRPGGDIRPPTKIKNVAPAYPAAARAARVEGFVIIDAIIGPDGKVQNARVIRSNPLLDAAALEAVRQWEYTPTRLNGAPIAILMTVTVNFRLR